MSFNLSQASTNEEIAICYRLFEEYAGWLNIDLSFQNFQSELASLPGQYSPPNGRLLLASANQKPAGCIALRPLEDNICEMKRLFVRPSFRKQRLGKLLVKQLITEARAIGYSTHAARYTQLYGSSNQVI